MRSSEPEPVTIKAKNGDEYDMTYKLIEDGDEESSDSEEEVVSIPTDPILLLQHQRLHHAGRISQ